MTIPISFGAWLAQRRRTLDLTQTEFAQRANCALGTLRKWELDERRPSKELAQRLAVLLDIPPGLHDTFVKVARAQLPVDRLHLLDLDVAAGRGVRLYPVHEVAPDEPVPGEPPFKGLSAFGVADADLFFGRELLTAKLVEHVREGRRLIILVGASGSGKSSLVRAGLVAALTHDQRLAAGTLLPAGSTHWQVHLITPEAHPLETLALTLTRDAPSLSMAAALIDDLARDSRSLHLAAVRLVSTMSDIDTGAGQRGLLLVVDQFEELFTHCRNAAERTAFIDNLLVAAALKTDGPITIVITLRADFYAHCAPFAALRDALVRWQDYIGPMNPVELRRAIEEPARRGGWEFEPGLVDLLLRDAGQEPGALPLLSHVLLETWQRRRGHRLTFAGYTEAGGLHGAIAQTAEHIYQQAPPAIQTILRRTFLQLTELGEGTQDTRRRATLRDLIARPQEAATVEAVLQRLAAARLIMLADGTAEVAHEALIREWPTLREWLLQDREALRLQRRLSVAAAEWANAGHDRSFLAAGARLAQFETLATDAPVALSADENAYLQASLAERDRQVVAEQERQATLAANLRRSEALRLAAEANVLLQAGGKAELIALLSIRSITRWYTPQGDAALAGAATLEYPIQLLAGGGFGVAWSPDGQTVLTGCGWDIQLWETRTGMLLRTFTGHTGMVNRCAFSPDGQYVLSGSGDSTARLWNVQTGVEHRRFMGHSATVNAVDFSPDGQYVLTGSDDTTVRLWDVETGQARRVFLGHEAAVLGVAYAPDGQHVATSSLETTVLVWSVASGAIVQRLIGHLDAVQTVAYGAGGALLLTGGYDKTARLWDARLATEVRSFTGHKEYIKDVAFAPDGSTLLTGSDDGVARLWDIQTGAELHHFVGHTSFVFGVAFSPDGRFVTTSSGDGTTRIWMTHSLRGVRWFHVHIEGRVVFSPDGRYVLTGDDGRTVWLRDAHTGDELRQFVGHTGSVHAPVFSPNGRWVLTGSFDGTVRLWDVTTGTTVRTFTGSSAPVRTAVFSPDGRRVLAGGNDVRAYLWDSQTGMLLQTYAGHTDIIFDVAFSPDGRQVLTGSVDGTARLWEASTGALLQLFPTGAASIAFTPDGRTALTGDWSGAIRCWDVNSGVEGRQVVGHTASIWQIVCSPDGRYLLTASGDQTARLWDMQTGTELRRFTGHTGTVYGVAFSTDGRTVLTSSSDGTARLWDVDYHETIRYLSGRLLRDFSHDERAQYNIGDTEPTCPV